MCRSFYDLLVVKILEKIIKYWACNGILCHMALSSIKGLKCFLKPEGEESKHKMQSPGL